MRKALFSLSIALLLNGCIDHKVKSGSRQEEIPKANAAFQKFLTQFPDLALPLEIKACGAMPDVKILDGPISYTFNRNPEYIYGKFTTGRNHAVITLSPTDCLLPILTTYGPEGNKIDSKPLAIGQCSDGPCYKCEEALTIGKDLTIYVADTMQTFECDEDDLPKGKPLTTKVIYKEGQINTRGTIELSAEKQNKL